jgi:hypothetical protein
MPTNEIAARMAPCLWPNNAQNSHNIKANIQMVMPFINAILRKKHAENALH